MALPGKYLSLTLLVTAACSQVPIEAAPTPVQVLLRARIGGATEQRYAGPLVFAEADSLVMTDMRHGQRVTVRTGPTVVLEIYRGQRSSAGAIVKSAARSALFGGLVGAAAGLLGAGTSAVLGGDVGGIDDWVRGGSRCRGLVRCRGGRALRGQGGRACLGDRHRAPAPATALQLSQPRPAEARSGGAADSLNARTP